MIVVTVILSGKIEIFYWKILQVFGPSENDILDSDVNLTYSDLLVWKRDTSLECKIFYLYCLSYRKEDIRVHYFDLTGPVHISLTLV